MHRNGKVATNAEPFQRQDVQIGLCNFMSILFSNWKFKSSSQSNASRIHNEVTILSPFFALTSVFILPIFCSFLLRFDRMMHGKMTTGEEYEVVIRWICTVNEATILLLTFFMAQSLQHRRKLVGSWWMRYFMCTSSSSFEIIMQISEFILSSTGNCLTRTSEGASEEKFVNGRINKMNVSIECHWIYINLLTWCCSLRFVCDVRFGGVQSIALTLLLHVISGECVIDVFFTHNSLASSMLFPLANDANWMRLI